MLLASGGTYYYLRTNGLPEASMAVKGVAAHTWIRRNG